MENYQRIENWVNKLENIEETENFNESKYFDEIKDVVFEISTEQWEKVIEKHPLFFLYVPEEMIDEELCITTVMQSWFLIAEENMLKTDEVFTEVAETIKYNNEEETWLDFARGNEKFNGEIISRIKLELELSNY